jgi:hypothetical protein
MECSRCHDDTAILVNGDLCWQCAFPRPSDLAAQQHALADERGGVCSQDTVTSQ